MTHSYCFFPGHLNRFYVCWFVITLRRCVIGRSGHFVISPLYTVRIYYLITIITIITKLEIFVIIEKVIKLIIMELIISIIQK